jgi:hypothetical protein
MSVDQVYWDESDCGDYLTATDALVAARLAYATAFIRYRIGKNITDGQAAHMAYIETKGAVDLAEARQYVARAVFGKEA